MLARDWKIPALRDARYARSGIFHSRASMHDHVDRHVKRSPLTVGLELLGGHGIMHAGARSATQPLQSAGRREAYGFDAIPTGNRWKDDLRDATLVRALTLLHHYKV